MKWLSMNMVEAFHRESLVRFGGGDGLRDAGLLASAMAQPENILAYELDADLFRRAAANCAGIVKNHPFVDGNKPTGTLAAIAFLAINGVQLKFVEAEIAVMIIGLASGEFKEDQVAAWFRRSA